MKNTRFFASFVALLAIFFSSGFLWNDDDPAEERKEILTMREKTLKSLYKELPAARSVIKESVGYAVFSNLGINLLVVSTANGSGVARNVKTGKDIFMKMFSAGVGIGAGVKDFRGIFVFSTQTAFDTFVNEGWQANAQGDAAAKSDDKGQALTAAIEVAPGIILYQITENGLALQATIQGTKYWKNDELNK